MVLSKVLNPITESTSKIIFVLIAESISSCLLNGVSIVLIKKESYNSTFSIELIHSVTVWLSGVLILEESLLLFKTSILVLS